jgi:trk system potassium uptake protein TrkH
MSALRVDVPSVFSMVGSLLRWFSLTLLIPVATAFIYGESPVSFLVTMVLAFAVGFLLEQATDDPEMGTREGFLVVALSWLTVALFGALPYILEGSGTVARPLNAFFESMSGFTTTGSTVMASIGFEQHTHALLMWRQLTQWLGGMGIVVLAVAILPKLSVGGAQLMQAEAPGPGLEKLTPRIAQTAQYLWIFYVSFTALEIVLLYGSHLIGYSPKMTLYQSISHAFTTMPTGGFSPMGRSIEAFSATVQWIIIPFMFIAGMNFALIWHGATDRLSRLWEDPEWRFYGSVIIGLGAVIAVSLLYANMVGYGIESSLRHGLFQALTIVTTTGYASADYIQWPVDVQILMLAAMFIGGCAGSTGGSVKVVRWFVVLKSMARELFTIVHPSAVQPVRLGKKALDNDVVRSILVFVFLYFLMFWIGTGVILVECQIQDVELSTIEVMGTTATAIGNVGPSFGSVGPMNNFTVLPPLTRFTMILLMWFGRLELITVIVLFTPAYWLS